MWTIYIVNVSKPKGERNATMTLKMTPTPRFMANDSGYRVDMFYFEQQFDQDEFLPWMIRKWTISCWCAAAYVVIIFSLQRYMSNKPRYELRGPLVIWSTTLAIFSIIGAFRTVPEVAYVIRNHGLAYSVCNRSYYYGPTAFWSFAFAISKAYELGDTLFIVLRKQPLIFLHWYHHITVMIYCWYSYVDYTGTGRWFMAMNFVVHAFMYTYYAFRAARIFHIPRFVNISVTCLQIAQMVAGLALVAYAYRIKSSGSSPQDGECQMSYLNMTTCAAMYASYFALFAHYFYVAYVKKCSRKLREASTTNNNYYEANHVKKS